MPWNQCPSILPCPGIDGERIDTIGPGIDIRGIDPGNRPTLKSTHKSVLGQSEKIAVSVLKKFHKFSQEQVRKTFLILTYKNNLIFK